MTKKVLRTCFSNAITRYFENIWQFKRLKASNLMYKPPSERMSVIYFEVEQSDTTVLLVKYSEIIL